LIGLVLGLGLPLVTLLLVDYFDSRLKNADAVESNSALAVAGYIYTNKFKSEIPVVQYPNSSITESFRTLRANLYYLMSDPSRKIIAVHSPMVGEGKSFIAINLVAALALNNKNVLLVETDMRRPRLYLALKLNRETGLSTYLSGKSAFEQIVQPTKIKGLSFVASGAATRNNAELLNSKLFTRFIEEARAQFDLVILDSVPTDILSDAITIGRQADINLMVLRFNYSTQDQLKSVNKIAHEGAMENMVLVLNDVSDEKARKQLKKYGYQ
jgi:capsular exopolysaccharide synthesis family protein